jgi:uncharacterized membrane protein
VVVPRPIRILVMAVLFGAVASYVKGLDAGLRGELGNLSAPWLLLPFLASLRCRSLVRGALVGITASVIALVVFYAVQTFMLQGHLGGGGFPRELVTEIGANRIYLLAGVATGPLFGAVGAWFGRTYRVWTWAAVGGLLVGEICVVALVQGHQLLPAPLYFNWGVDSWTAYWLEMACGLAIILVAGSFEHFMRGKERRGGHGAI